MNSCPEKEMNGICSKGADCIYCNAIPINPSIDFIDNVQLNVNAKDFVPKAKKDKLPFNINAKEYIPKSQKQNEEVDFEEDEQELDMIMKDVVEDQVWKEIAKEKYPGEDKDEDEDQNVWYPKYKGCECCKGYVYKCKGNACESLGQCFCKMQDDCEGDDA